MKPYGLQFAALLALVSLAGSVYSETPGNLQGGTSPGGQALGTPGQPTQARPADNAIGVKGIGMGIDMQPINTKITTGTTINDAQSTKIIEINSQLKNTAIDSKSGVANTVIPCVWYSTVNPVLLTPAQLAAISVCTSLTPPACTSTPLAQTAVSEFCDPANTTTSKRYTYWTAGRDASCNVLPAYDDKATQCGAIGSCTPPADKVTNLCTDQTVVGKYYKTEKGFCDLTGNPGYQAAVTTGEMQDCAQQVTCGAATVSAGGCTFDIPSTTVASDAQAKVTVSGASTAVFGGLSYSGIAHLICDKNGYSPDYSVLGTTPPTYWTCDPKCENGASNPPTCDVPTVSCDAGTFKYLECTFDVPKTTVAVDASAKVTVASKTELPVNGVTYKGTAYLVCDRNGYGYDSAKAKPVTCEPSGGCNASDSSTFKVYQADKGLSCANLVGDPQYSKYGLAIDPKNTLGSIDVATCNDGSGYIAIGFCSPPGFGQEAACFTTENICQTGDAELGIVGIPDGVDSITNINPRAGLTAVTRVNPSCLPGGSAPLFSYDTNGCLTNGSSFTDCRFTSGKTVVLDGASACFKPPKTDCDPKLPNYEGGMPVYYIVPESSPSAGDQYQCDFTAKLNLNDTGIVSFYGENTISGIDSAGTPGFYRYETRGEADLVCKPGTSTPYQLEFNNFANASCVRTIVPVGDPFGVPLPTPSVYCSANGVQYPKGTNFLISASINGGTNKKTDIWACTDTNTWSCVGTSCLVSYMPK